MDSGHIMWDSPAWGLWPQSVRSGVTMLRDTDHHCHSSEDDPGSSDTVSCFRHHNHVMNDQTDSPWLHVTRLKRTGNKTLISWPWSMVSCGQRIIGQCQVCIMTRSCGESEDEDHEEYMDQHEDDFNKWEHHGSPTNWLRFFWLSVLVYRFVKTKVGPSYKVII